MSGPLPRWVASIGALLAFACGGGDPRPSVVMVVGDTLRADKLSCMGGPEGLTPYLDRIAAAGVRFDQARSHAPWTSCAPSTRPAAPRASRPGHHASAWCRASAAARLAAHMPGISTLR